MAKENTKMKNKTRNRKEWGILEWEIWKEKKAKYPFTSLLLGDGMGKNKKAEQKETDEKEVKEGLE